MKDTQNILERPVDRRSFIKKGAMAAGAATVGVGLLSHGLSALAQESTASTSLTQGDIAILQFLAAAELIESDLWQQYAELGGIGNNPPIEVDPNQSLNNYQIALSNLDGDAPQYISSNTLDEISHANFPECLPGVEGRRSGEPRQVPHAAGQQGGTGGEYRAAHQPDAAQRGHQLVRSLSQRHQS